MMFSKQSKVLVLDDSVLNKEDMPKTDKLKIIKKISNSDYVIFNTSLPQQNKNLKLFIKITNKLCISNFGVFSMPFKFEGKLKLHFAGEAIIQLYKTIDDMVIINSDDVIDTLSSKINMENANKIIREVRNKNANIVKYYFENCIDFAKIKNCLLFNYEKLSTV